MENAENPEISVTQALNQIQSWVNANEFEKAIQGCQEILQIEPSNKRALALMKQAEDLRHTAQAAKPQMPTSAPTEPVAPAATPPTAANPAEAPVQETKPGVQIEEDHSIFLQPGEQPKKPKGEKRKLFLAMLIPAVLVVVIGGGVIWVLSDRQREEIIEELVTEDTVDTEYQERNNIRQDELGIIGDILEDFEVENGAFPSVSQVEDIILASGEFDEVPLDPMHDQLDPDGQMFGYYYAVYDTLAGFNTAYVISAIFEDNQGKGYDWTRGDDILDYPDYRDLTKKNVHLLGDAKSGDDDTMEEESSGPKVKVKRN